VHFIHLRAHGQGKGDEHPTYAHYDSGMVCFTFFYLRLHVMLVCAGNHKYCHVELCSVWWASV